MPLALRAKLSGEFERIFREPISLFYLGISREYAKIALRISNKPKRLTDERKYSIVSIIFSALFVEALVNQMAEEYFQGGDFNEFDRCRGEFKNATSLSNAAWKWIKLFEKSGLKGVDENHDLIVCIDRLMKTRNTLAHYKPEETAAKTYGEVSPVRANEHGGFTIDINLMQRPTRVEPSFLETDATALNAIEHYHSARNLLGLWGTHAKWDDSIFSSFRNIEISQRKLHWLDFILHRLS